MSGKEPPKSSRDRLQQRVPSGPRPPSTAASTARSHDTFMTAPSRGFTLDDIPRFSNGSTSQSREASDVFEYTADMIDSPELMDSPTSSRFPQTTSPDTLPVALPTVKSPKRKPTALRLNTQDLLAPATSPTKPISPGLQHWQQVRDHVMTPAEERAAHSLARPGPAHEKKKTFDIVSKAVGRFGMKQAADHVIRGDEIRKDTLAMKAEFGDLSVEQRDEIARERRRFARDVKTCLDACAAEETKRRLTRLGQPTAGGDMKMAKHGHTAEASGTSSHGSQPHPQRHALDNEFYAFAPLLTELHRHMPAARAKKPWSRTCPHHAAILAELGAAFLDDGITTAGERQQALEVFGTVVRNWAADSAEEELSRWTWLCHVLLWDDRQLRDRGLTQLDSLLQYSAMDHGHGHKQHSPAAFINLSVALLRLLHALDTSHRQEKHVDLVMDLIRKLSEGSMLNLEKVAVAEWAGIERTVGRQGVECRELFWVAVGIAVGTDVKLAEWLFSPNTSYLQVSLCVSRPGPTDEQLFNPPPILHGTPPIVLHLRSRAISTFLKSFASSVNHYSTSQLNLIWQATRRILELELRLVSTTDELCYQWADFLLSFEISQYSSNEEEDIEQSEDPFRITLTPAQSARVSSKAYREALVRYWQLGGRWETGIRQAARVRVSLNDKKRAYTDILDGECSTWSIVRIGPDVLGKQTPHPAWPILLKPSSLSESPVTSLSSHEYANGLANLHYQSFARRGQKLPTTSPVKIPTIAL
jgi:hypothetical protein